MSRNCFCEHFGGHADQLLANLFLCPVTVPKVFPKVNSVQSPVSEEENSHNILTFCLAPTLPHRTLLRDRDVVKILKPYTFCHNIITTFFGYCFRYFEAARSALIRSHNFAVLMEAHYK